LNSYSDGYFAELPKISTQKLVLRIRHALAKRASVYPIETEDPLAVLIACPDHIARRTRQKENPAPFPAPGSPINPL